jgi:hypothetical protein
MNLFYSSPTTELTRTPIVATDEAPKKKEDNLVKKLADKLLATAISNDENKLTDEKPAKKSKKLKNLIFEDEENAEDLDRFSTPPKKALGVAKDTRTPLSCVANTNTPKSRQGLATSTPKSKVLVHLQDENVHSPSRIPVATPRRLH